MSEIPAGARKEHLTALAVLALCLAFFYSDIVFTGHTFFVMNRTAGTMPLPDGGPYAYPGGPGGTCVSDPGALAWVVETYVFHSRQTLRNFELPLWNPYSGMGNPHVGSGHAGIFDPLAIPVYLAPRSLYPLMSDIEVLLRFLIAGFFTYYFLRRLGIGLWPAIAGGLAFMHVNYAIDFGNHSSSKVFMLLPLLMCAYKQLLHNTGMVEIALAAGVIAWTVVADFAESTFIVLQFATLWCAFDAGCRVYASEPLSRWSVARRLAGGLIAAVILGMALAAPVILPLLEDVALCDMSYHGAASGVGSATWLPGHRIMAILTFYKTGGFPYAPHFYVSILVLALASPLAFFRLSHSRRAVVFFGLYFLLGFAKLFDFPLTQWIGLLPVYKQVHLGKYLSPTLEFCLAALAAFTIESILIKSEIERRSTPALLAATALLGAITGYFILQREPSLWEPSMFTRALAKAAVMAALPVCVVGACEFFRWPRKYIAYGLLAAVFFEVNRSHMGAERPFRCDPYKAPPFVEFLQHQEKPSRFFARDGILYPNVALAYELNDIRELTALEPSRRKMFLQSLVDPGYSDLRFTGCEDGIRLGKAFDLLNTEYVIAASNVPPLEEPARPFPDAEIAAMPGNPRFEKVFERDGIKIFKNHNAYPRAFVVHAVESASSTEDALGRMARENFDPSSRVVLEGNPPESSSDSATPVPPDKAAIVYHSANTVKIKAALKKPGVLVLSESYFPGWNAFVDGKPAPIYPADVMLRGVILEAGEHEIEFVYFPASFKVGLALSCGAMLIILAGFGAVYVSRRRSHTEVRSVSKNGA